MGTNGDISTATERNWARLRTDGSTRLTKRANKRRSSRRILPLEYVSHGENRAFVQQVAALCGEKSLDPVRIVEAAARRLLEQQDMLTLPHVRQALGAYALEPLAEIENLTIPEDEWDILGLLYQSMLPEGRKNELGSYYTPEPVARNMTKDLDFSRGQRFLDPCCGSGSFLLSASAPEPEQLYGVDLDPAAVLIARVNLLLKYRNRVFVPQIFCGDFLELPPERGEALAFPEPGFSYIVTNPPWGAASGQGSGETFSRFFVEAYRWLRDQGDIRFLFPESLLHVRSHRAFRSFLLEQCHIRQITRYSRLFSGVSTPYLDLRCRKEAPGDTVMREEKGRLEAFPLEGFCQSENRVFSFLFPEELEILRMIRQRGEYDLSGSIWALGIVTGDNKGKLREEGGDGWEPIYTGREIRRYTLAPPRKYIRFDPSKLQQAAREAWYRAPEKLAYKFISGRLTFAYDNSGNLFLNSANLLIPRIPQMACKTVLAFLNSEVFQFFYQCVLGGVKVLKGNLLELPFPQISGEEDQMLAALVDRILRGEGEADAALQEAVYRLYRFSPEQAACIHRRVTWSKPGAAIAGAAGLGPGAGAPRMLSARRKTNGISLTFAENCGIFRTSSMHI